MNLETLQNSLNLNSFLFQIIGFLIVLFLAVIVFFFARLLITKTTNSILSSNNYKLAEIIIDSLLINKLARIIPLLIIYSSANWFSTISIFIQRFSLALIILCFVEAVATALNIFNTVYAGLEKSKNRPIKGYLQIISILSYILGGIIILAVLLGKSPLLLVSGFGAMTAILMFLFKDTILSLLASLQITFNDLVKIGDWLEVPQYNADGDVIDIALHTIKIQNWDKTISVIPTHKLIEGTFKNWRGMSNSGGRRIKRSIHIDISTIKFVDEKMLEKFKKVQLIKDYISSKELSIADYHLEHNIDTSEIINKRILTNIGTFRAYIIAYLKNNPKIRQDMTFLVRQLEPTTTGLPLQLYVFTNDTVWANYETIQADIFDHLLAVIPEFGLKVFQEHSDNI